MHMGVLLVYTKYAIWYLLQSAIWRLPSAGALIVLVQLFRAEAAASNPPLASVLIKREVFDVQRPRIPWWFRSGTLL